MLGSGTGNRLISSQHACYIVGFVTLVGVILENLLKPLQLLCHPWGNGIHRADISRNCK